MFEFTLKKSLYFELDKYEMEGATEKKIERRTIRRLEVSYPSCPDITSITAEMRELPYLDRYYFYINDEPEEANLRDHQVKQVIYEFFKEHFPGYLKAGLPDDMKDMDILECFEVFNMPDYRPKHAFPGLVTLEDIRAGNVRPDERQAAFPGLEFLTGWKRRDPDKPAISEYDGYTELNGDREKGLKKIDALKAQFSNEMKAMNIDENLEKIDAEQIMEDVRTGVIPDDLEGKEYLSRD